MPVLKTVRQQTKREKNSNKSQVNSYHAAEPWQKKNGFRDMITGANQHTSEKYFYGNIYKFYSLPFSQLSCVLFKKIVSRIPDNT